MANGSHGLTTANALDGARYLNHTVANKHLATVHGLIKKECEELAEAIVSAYPCVFLYNVEGGGRSTTNTGQGQTVDKPLHA